MDLISQTSRAVKRFVFGSWEFHQQCALGLCDPQQEVSVQLHGPGIHWDVTERNVIAAAKPLTIGIGGRIDSALRGRDSFWLKFCERGGKKCLLGVIGLQLKETIPLGREQLCLFETRVSRNYCLPRRQLWAQYQLLSYKHWRARQQRKTSDFHMVSRELHNVFTFYICPRPVVLVTVVEKNVLNIFPMDLIGPIGTCHFSLALHGTSAVAPLLERSLRIALSNVPVEQSSVAIGLGPNHKKAGIDHSHLPFSTTPSPKLGLPVPEFASRVREMEIEAVRNLGSHKLFLARILSDQRRADGAHLFFTHGSYHLWRQQAQQL